MANSGSPEAEDDQASCLSRRLHPDPSDLYFRDGALALQSSSLVPPQVHLAS